MHAPAFLRKLARLLLQRLRPRRPVLTPKPDPITGPVRRDDRMHWYV